MYINQQGTIPVITCRLSVENKARLVQIAGQHEMGISQYIRHLLENHIQNGTQLNMPQMADTKPPRAIKTAPVRVAPPSAPRVHQDTPGVSHIYTNKEIKERVLAVKDVCKRCDGEGMMLKTISSGKGKGRAKTKEYPCPHCDGTGKR